MDNLEPITRNEMFLNGDDLEPITREEMILAGEDLEPITRHEWFLKKYRGGGGGGGYDLVNIPNLPADIASFNDGTDLPMASLKVSVTPYQDLHGYDGPWAGGAGKNICDANFFNATGITVTGNTVVGKGNAFHEAFVASGIPNLTFDADTQYTISMKASTDASASQTGNGLMFKFNYTDNTSSTLWLQNTSTTPTSYTVSSASGKTISKITMSYGGSSGDNTWTLTDIQIEKGSTATPFMPYSNICPIIGWDEAVVTVADDAESPTTSHEYTIDLDGTRYGGVLDATNGAMDDTLDHIASYNGEALPSTWISDRDVYAEGTTPTIGAEVVYTRATPITVQLAPQPVKSIEGENNISANCGQITEVKYFKRA